jgi:protein involved in polysaccharide export with SLBB domain
VKAKGLTENELEQAVSKAYENAQLIRNARVSVTVEEARGRSFSIQGNISSPGEFEIKRPDFRMLDALALAQGIKHIDGLDYVFVIRKPPEHDDESAQPSPDNSPTSPPPLQQPTVPATGPADLLSPPPTTPTGPQGRANPDPGSGHTVFMDNVPGPNPSPPFKFDDVEKPPIEDRVIRVPIDLLRLKGQLKYNLVIRPGDMIMIPDPVTGYYFVGGHIIHPGVYNIEGNDRITLKKAWIAAGGPDNYTIPTRTEVVRRVGSNREVCARVDLAKVLAMQQPDIYLKPNDVVYIGTHFLAPFIGSVRDSFTLDYGAAFVYDEDFGGNNGNSSTNSTLGTPPSP